ncbi:hypothetical protein A4X13_0g3733 [Tilletia indica]|uniref:Mediator of RNA polymerase II transcription subunit 11 n=1 Tax=Tilletia indica TaxID=43049 RepID=A0A177TC21_9BASI|nr:hypothetical protein A4X13_0g3733 [Tilletia indica]
MASINSGVGGGGGGTAGGAGAGSTFTRAERNARTTALLAKLAEADHSLAQVLDLAAQAIDTLLPSSPSAADGAGGSTDAEIERFETSTTDYFALLNDVQLFLRSAVYHLVHNAKRAPLTPAQTSSAFNALRAATVAKGHSLRPEAITQYQSATPSAPAPTDEKGDATTVEAEDAAKKVEAGKEPIIGLPDDAHLSLGALRIQHQAWSDLAAALEALQ